MASTTGPPPCVGSRRALDLGAIEASLCEVAERQHLRSCGPAGRERLDQAAIRHMLAGYAFVGELIEREIDLFSIAQLRLFLELNALVLCGRNEEVRSSAIQHLAATEKHFYDHEDGGIRDVIEWYAFHATESAWRRAAGTHIRILSEPQLFIEGNHRTAALVMSYILAREGHPPFVLTVENAGTFFRYSTRFNAMSKTGLYLRWQMPWLVRGFARFLEAQADDRFLRSS